MSLCIRSMLRAGAAMTVAFAIALAPVVATAPSAPQLGTVQVVAETRLLAANETIALPTPPSIGLTAAAAPAFSIGGNIIPIYNAIQPWVAYGFSLAEYVVGWIPGVGLLAPQITIVYALIQPIVQSIVYNTAYVLQGTVGLGQALANVVYATVNSFGNLIVNEINWVLSFFPPLPPLPPFSLLARPAASLALSSSATKLAPATGKTATTPTTTRTAATTAGNRALELPKTSTATPSRKLAADTPAAGIGTGLSSLTKTFTELTKNAKTRGDRSAGTPPKSTPR